MDMTVMPIFALRWPLQIVEGIWQLRDTTAAPFIAMLVGFLTYRLLVQPFATKAIRFDDLDWPNDPAVSQSTAHFDARAHRWLQQNSEAIPLFLTEPDFDRAQWLGNVIRAVWQPMRRALPLEIRKRRALRNAERVRPSLAARLLRLIDLDVDVDLGPTPFRFGGIKTFRETGSRMTTVEMEAQVLWGGETKVDVAARLFPSLLGARAPRLPLLRVSKPLLNGQFRISVFGIMAERPYCQTIRLAFRAAPQINLALSLLGLPDVMGIPIVGEVIQFVIRSLIMRYMGIPRSVSYSPEQQANQSRDRPIGMLILTRLAIKDMKPPSLSLFDRVVDPFVVLSTTAVGTLSAVGQSSISRRTTERIMNRKTYEWAEDIYLPIYSTTDQQLSILVFDDDYMSNELLVESNFSLSADEQSDIMNKSQWGDESTLVIRQNDQIGRNKKKWPGIFTCQARYVEFPKRTPEEIRYFRMLYASHPHLERGNLSVMIEWCSNLPNVIDARIDLKLFDANGGLIWKDRTNAEHQTKGPVFMEQFDFCNVGADTTLLLDVVDAKSGDKVAWVKIRVREVAAELHLNETMNLMGVGCAQIKVDLHWSTFWLEESFQFSKVGAGATSRSDQSTRIAERIKSMRTLQQGTAARVLSHNVKERKSFPKDELSNIKKLAMSSRESVFLQY